MAALTNQRHEKFALNLAAGMTQKDAYLQAGYDCAPLTAEAKASALVRTSKVAARVAELQARVTSKLERNAEDIARFHWSVIDNEEAPLSDRLKASSLEMRRFSDYSDKHEMSGAVDVRLLAAVAELSPDELRALAAKR